jgi:hypothetical protein
MHIAVEEALGTQHIVAESQPCIILRIRAPMDIKIPTGLRHRLLETHGAGIALRMIHEISAHLVMCIAQGDAMFVLRVQ